MLDKKSITREEAYKMVGKGWKRLLERTYNYLELVPENVCVNTVKEKFAGLRIYVDRASEEVHRYLNLVCTESYTICELCGGIGDTCTPRGNWLRTLCKKCCAKVAEQLEC
jgi:hypothetical protein